MIRATLLGLIAGACALVGVVATAQPSFANEYADAYVRALGEVKTKFFYTRSVPAERWTQLEKAAVHIQTQADLENQLRTLATAVHPEIQLFGRAASDAVAAKIAGGFVGFGLGFETITVMDAKGIRVTEVEEASTAEDAGLKVGDLIVAINGDVLDGHYESYANMRLNGNTGDTVKLSVSRGDLRLEITAKFDFDNSIGIRYEQASPVKYPLIDSVNDKSIAEHAGLKKNDRVVSINGVPMRGANAQTAVAELKGFIGQSVQVRVERDGKTVDVIMTRGIVSDWGRMLDFRSQGSTSRDPINAPYNYSVNRVKDLDFDGGIPQQVFDEIVGDPQFTQPKLILDLQGADGHNPDTAARIAAHFVKQGTILALEAADGSRITYEVHEGKLLRLRNGDMTSAQVVSTHVGDYTDPMAVLVDGHTAHAANALAYGLQSSGRAIVVGTGTSTDTVLQTYIDVPTSEYTLKMRFPTAAVLSLKANAPYAVHPDITAIASAQDTALTILNGGSQYTSSSFIFLMCMVLSALTVLGAFLHAFFGKKVPPPTAPEPEESEEEADDVAATEEKVTWSGLGRMLLRMTIVSILIVGLFVAVVQGLSRLVIGPPIGGRAEVLVELFVDGSESSNRELTIINELKQELKGDIRFEVIDLREHPEYRKADGPKKPFAVEQAPFVWIYTVQYDRHGVEVKKGGSGSASAYSLTKRSLLRSIRWAANDPNPGSIKVPLTREKPAK